MEGVEAQAVSLGDLALGAGLAFAGVGAIAILVGVDEIGRTGFRDPKAPSLPGEIARPAIEIGAATLVAAGLGLLLGGRKPGTVGRGLIWGALAVPVVPLSILIVGVENHPLTRTRP